ncbi:MAG: HAD-IC family P-type ATPase, partial [Oscillospiraceae bacterium]|nr:HAD-IC family P-type ATPase [Oscillospiraceae bacterium]
MTRKQKKVLYRIIASSLLMIALHFAPATGLAKFALYLIPYLIIGYDILIDAVRGVINRQLFDENFLMAVATVGAMALGVFKTGDYLEGIAVMLFYQIGELFQSCAIGKSRRSISELMDIRPDYANIEQNGTLIKVAPDEIEPDTVIVVQPGEKVPIDGVIVEGVSTLDTAALTGESRPRDVAIGDEIISGCINMTGVLKIKTTKPFGESTVSKILDMVENASSRKSRSEDFISRFARFYTPAVCYGALALALIPPLVRIFVFGVSADWGEWLYRALTFLVISCPCALVISIPLSFFAGIGGASRAGVLVKGSNYLEALSQAGTVVFDKTGTLTKGDFEVAEIKSIALPDENLLEYAALAEAASSHPISQSLKRAYGKEIDRSRVSEIEDISGNGVTAKVDGIEIGAGNIKLMNRLGISVSE